MQELDTENTTPGKFPGKRGGSHESLKYQVFPRQNFPRHAMSQYHNSLQQPSNRDNRHRSSDTNCWETGLFPTRT